MAANAGFVHDTASTNIEPFALLKVSEVGTNRIRCEAADLCGIQVEDIEDIYPATPLQEGTLLLTEQHTNMCVNHRTYALAPGLSHDRLRAAWALVVQANAILRTRLVHVRGHGTLQVILKSQFEWCESANLEQSLANPSSLGKAGFGTPLCYFTLFATHLAVTLHHAVYDGWTSTMLLQDFEQAYIESSTTSKPPFNRFISYLSNTDISRCQSFWKRQLEEAPISAFPKLSSTDRGIEVDTSVSRKIYLSRSKTSEITAATLVRGAWALMICTHCGTHDVTFGMGLSGRDTPVVGISDIADPTVVSVPIRVKLDTSMLVPEFLCQLQQQATEMIPYQQIGLQRIRATNSKLKSVCGFHSTLVIHPSSQSERRKPINNVNS